MKIPAGIVLLLLPVMTIAQNYPGMGEGDTQNMMLQMQKMQTCMQGVDQSQLQAFEQRASKIEAEVKSLCASGKRDDAQQKAMAFGQEVVGNPSAVESGLRVLWFCPEKRGPLVNAAAEHLYQDFLVFTQSGSPFLCGCKDLFLAVTDRACKALLCE
jgi:hypothetical protein